MPKLNDTLLASIASLTKQHIPSPRLDAELLLAYTLAVDRSWLHAHGSDEISDGQLQKFQKCVERRLKREPVAYITGTKEFYGRDFIVTPDVLIPRPETEDLVELTTSFLDTSATSQQRGAKGKQLAPSEAERKESGEQSTIKMLDIGCGSGCVGITLKLERPEYKVTLSDISSSALKVARRNATKLGADVTLVESNLLSSFPLPASSFSAIVANLPYVNATWETSPETAHEPALALYADQNGLALIFKLIEESSVALRNFGYLLLEADPEQHQEIIEFASKNGFVHKETRGYALGFMKQLLA